MAETKEDLLTYLKSHKPAETFSRYAYYDEDADVLSLYFADGPYYAERINKRVTVFISSETEKLVGCAIKNVRSVLEDMKWFDAEIKLGKVKVKFLFLSFRGMFDDKNDQRECYRKLGEMVSEEEIEVRVPELG